VKEVVYVVMVDGKKTRVLPEERKVNEGPNAIERVGKLVEDHATTVVAEHAAHAAVSAAMPWASAMLVANPALGMVAQLALASRSIDPQSPIAVLGVEQAGVRKDTLDRCERSFGSSGSDVAYPSAGGQAGYPVYLSPEAREKLDGMPDGDLLTAVRANNELTKTAVEVRDVGIYLDLGADDSHREALRQITQDSLERETPGA